MTLTRPIWASIATAPATIAGTMNPCTTAVAHCTPIPAAAAAVSQPVMSTHAETIPMSRLARAGFHVLDLRMMTDAFQNGVKGLAIQHPDVIARRNWNAEPPLLQRVFEEGIAALGTVSDDRLQQEFRPLHDFLMERHPAYDSYDQRDRSVDLEDAVEALVAALPFEQCIDADGRLTEAAKRVALDATWGEEEHLLDAERLLKRDRNERRYEAFQRREQLAPIRERDVEQGVCEELQQGALQLLERIPEAKRKAFCEIVAHDVWDRVQGDKSRYYADGQFNDAFRNLVHLVAQKRAKQKGWA